MGDAFRDLARDEQRHQRQMEQAAELYEAIKHGDTQHRAWLKEALEAYFTGREIPEPR